MENTIEVKTWSEFKEIAFNTKQLPLQYKEEELAYDIYISDSMTWHIKLLKGSSDSLDFENNYKLNANKRTIRLTKIVDSNRIDIFGERQEIPTQYTLLSRLKDLFDKLHDLFINGTALIKLWDGTNTAGITSTGRVKVDVLSDFIAKSSSAIVDIEIPINTDYWLLNLSSKSGIIDEIHITCDSDKFIFKIEADGTNYFSEQGVNLKGQYFLDVAPVSHIGTTTGKDFHWTLPIYFNNIIKIGLRNNLENNKKLKGYIILYREEIS